MEPDEKFRDIFMKEKNFPDLTELFKNRKNPILKEAVTVHMSITHVKTVYIEFCFLPPSQDSGPLT